MVTLSLSMLENPTRFHETMLHLAEVHNQRGVKAIECRSLLTIECMWVKFLSHTQLRKAAVNHHRLSYASSVTFSSDGIVGDVLFYTLRKCLGIDYNLACHLAWVKIYCQMLKVILYTIN